MSRHARIFLLLGIACLVAPAGAQEVEITEEALVAHLDSMAPKARAAQRVMQAEFDRRQKESRRINAAATDTFQVGLLTVVAPIDQVDMARRIYESVWSQYPFVDRSPTLESLLFTFQWSTERKGIPIEDHVAIRAEHRGFVTRRDIELQLTRNIGSSLRLDLDLQYRDPESLRVDDPITPSARREWIYRAVAFTPTTAADACLEGDAMQCWNLLGYGSSWREWSTSADRYALIRRGMRQPAGEAERAAFRSCWQGDLRQCDTAFEHLEEQGRLRAPLQSHGESQMSLLWIALQEGGEGAWGRLLANQHLPASEALAAVSGLPPEELAGKWRQHMLESRPDPHSDVGSSGLLATFWILAFAGFAMRSTRWRFA